MIDTKMPPQDGGRERTHAAMGAATPVLVGVLLAIATMAHGQTYRFVYDGVGSEAAGAEGLLLIHRAFRGFLDQYLPTSVTMDSGAGGTVANVGYRAARSALLDIPASHLAMLVQHEVFGHGARCRELGYENTSYSTSLFFPYGTGSGRTVYGTPPSGGVTTHEALLRTLAGNEATDVMAGQIVWKWMTSRRIHHQDALLYLFSSNNLEHYILSTWLNPASSGSAPTNDIATYLTEINRYYSPGSGGLIPPGAEVEEPLGIDDLALRCLLALGDPFQFFSLAAFAWSYLLHGEPEGSLPLIEAGRFRMMPRVRFGLSPFGIEYYADVYGVAELWKAGAYVGGGSREFADSWRFGLRCEPPPIGGWVAVDGGVDGWVQPEFELGGESLRTVPAGPGFAARLRADIGPPTVSWRLSIGVRYKTAGYLPGEPLEAGWGGAFGIGVLAP